MKKIKPHLLTLVLIFGQFLTFGQTSDPGVTSTANAGGNHAFTGTFANGVFSNWLNSGYSATAYNLIGYSNQHAGFGVATGNNIVSPIIWMYTNSRNAFRVRTMNYQGDIATGKDLFTVRSTGNVGIGTTAPERRIEIGDEATNFSAFGRFDGFWSTNFERHSRLEFNDKNFGIGAGRLTNNGYDDDLYLWSYNGAGRDISFLSTSNGESDPSTWNHNMIIKGTNGFVGIGTTDPQSKLAVNGQIRATEVKVLANINVPDYVFEEDYELRTLQETKEYISTNKHLPEIPSAAEIGENGIDLGDMNMRLLKKIEELTLYQIGLMEKLEQQNSELQEMKKKLQEISK